MEKLKCTSCNGQLDLDENGKTATCRFCGTKYKLDGDKIIVINVGDSLSNASNAMKKTAAPIIVLFSGVFIFITALIMFASVNLSGFNVDEYNLEFKYGDGTQNGVFVQETLNKVNSKNKTSKDHKITVKYNNEETQDEDKIISIKQSLKSLKQYEVKYEYDKDGYINKIVIEDIK